MVPNIMGKLGRLRSISHSPKLITKPLLIVIWWRSSPGVVHP